MLGTGFLVVGSDVQKAHTSSRATRACTISFSCPTGVRHCVMVSAETLYEAAIVGFSILRRDGWVDPIAPGTQLDIEVRQPATKHTVSLSQLRRWADGVAASPEETLKKRRLKALLRE